VTNGRNDTSGRLGRPGSGTGASNAASGSEGMIDLLTAELPPVRRLPSLRVATAAVLASWFGLIAMAFGMGAARMPKGSFERLFADVWATGLVVGLLLAAAAAPVAALGAAIPGRESLVGLAQRAAASGLGLSLACALAALATSPVASRAVDRVDGSCFASAVGMALVPGAVLLGFQWAGWVQRPRRAAALTLLAGCGLGALAVHAMCPLVGAQHVLIEHASVPLVVMALASLPLAALLRRSVSHDR